MVDFFNLGYSQIISSLALIGGFFGAGTFYFMNQLGRTDVNRSWRIVSFVMFLVFFGGFIYILFFLSTTGNIFVEYSKIQMENPQILINLSCDDEMNCSASIPNQLHISCQEKTCPPQILCPYITPTPLEIQYSKSFKCPPILSIPTNLDVSHH